MHPLKPTRNAFCLLHSRTSKGFTVVLIHRRIPRRGILATKRLFLMKSAVVSRFVRLNVCLDHLPSFRIFVTKTTRFVSVFAFRETTCLQWSAAPGSKQRLFELHTPLPISAKMTEPNTVQWPFLPTDERPFFFHPRLNTKAPEYNGPCVYGNPQLRKRRRIEEDKERDANNEQCDTHAHNPASEAQQARKVRITPELRINQNASRFHISDIGDHIVPWVTERLSRVLVFSVERVENWLVAGRHQRLARCSADPGRYCKHVPGQIRGEDIVARIIERRRQHEMEQVQYEAPERELSGHGEGCRVRFQARVDDDDEVEDDTNANDSDGDDNSDDSNIDDFDIKVVARRCRLGSIPTQLYGGVGSINRGLRAPATPATRDHMTTSQSEESSVEDD